MDGVSFSLRSKFMLALTLVPLVALFVFLKVAIDIFERDKIAYVFDSLLTASKSAATQVRNDLNHIRTLAQTLALTVNTKDKTLSESGQFLLQSDRRLLDFGLYSWKSQDSSPTPIIEVEAQGGDPGPSLLIPEMPKGSVGFKTIDKASAIIWTRLGQADAWPQTIAAVRFRTHDLQAFFSNDGAQRTFLVQAGTGVLFGPRDSFLPQIISKSSFDSSLRQDGIRELQNKQGENVLLSTSSLGLSDLSVVTLINKDDALSAISVLIQKAALLFAGLVLCTLMISILASRRLTRSLQELLAGTIQVAQGRFDIDLHIKSSDEVGVLASSFTKMAQQISNLIRETKEKARMETELETAQTVQRTLFPPSHATLGSVEISGFYEPASECGGDWWHYFEDEEHVYVCIGDVTGHGAPAALLTSAARAASSVIQTTSNLSPKEFLSLLNSALYDTAHGRLMMTFFAAKIEKSTGLVTYANASHEPPVLLRNGIGPLTRSSFEYLQDVRSNRLGESRDIQVEESQIQLGTGDQIVFYTDGVVDLQNPEGKDYGERRYAKSLMNALSPRASTRLAVKNLAHDIQKWKLDAPLKDDVTFFVVRLDQTAKSKEANKAS